MAIELQHTSSPGAHILADREGRIPEKGESWKLFDYPKNMVWISAEDPLTRMLAWYEHLVRCSSVTRDPRLMAETPTLAATRKLSPKASTIRTVA
ncbi:hypothetical protein KKF84_13560 [Myxococcota bacterium]|nr:hypothetical protein [Myxococcota bacterium]MBU1536347.1 hypothetical protein [Myxococcota bacterium]